MRLPHETICFNQLTRQKNGDSQSGAWVTLETHGTSSYTGPWHDFRFRKLELSASDGINPESRVMKAERYFALHQLSNGKKIKVTVISFKADTLLWYQWENL